MSNSKDLLVAADGISLKSAAWECGFDFNQTSLDQNDTIFGSYSKSKQNGFNTSLIVEIDDESGENFGEFKDAFSETVLKHEVCIILI